MSTIAVNGVRTSHDCVEFVGFHGTFVVGFNLLGLSLLKLEGCGVQYPWTHEPAVCDDK